MEPLVRLLLGTVVLPSLTVTAPNPALNLEIWQVPAALSPPHPKPRCRVAQSEACAAPVFSLSIGGDEPPGGSEAPSLCPWPAGCLPGTAALSLRLPQNPPAPNRTVGSLREWIDNVDHVVPLSLIWFVSRPSPGEIRPMCPTALCSAHPMDGECIFCVARFFLSFETFFNL